MSREKPASMNDAQEEILARVEHADKLRIQNANGPHEDAFLILIGENARASLEVASEIRLLRDRVEKVLEELMAVQRDRCGHIIVATTEVR